MLKSLHLTLNDQCPKTTTYNSHDTANRESWGQWVGQSKTLHQTKMFINWALGKEVGRQKRNTAILPALQTHMWPLKEWMTASEVSIHSFFSFDAYWGPVMCHLLHWVLGTQWWVITAERGITQAETTPVPKSCEMSPSRFSSRHLNNYDVKANPFQR